MSTEYKVVDLNSSAPGALESKLNELSSQGWKLHTMLGASNESYSGFGKHRMIFERSPQPESRS